MLLELDGDRIEAETTDGFRREGGRLSTASIGRATRVIVASVGVRMRSFAR